MNYRLMPNYLLMILRCFLLVRNVNSSAAELNPFVPRGREGCTGNEWTSNDLAKKSH